MAGTSLQGLKGLKGLSAVSGAEYDKFVTANRDLIARHNYDPSYIAGLYKNKQFIDRYGVDAFKSLPSSELRNEMFRTDVINEEFTKRFSLKYNKNGMSDNDFLRYNQLSSDAKLKLLESGYLTNTEFENKWNKDVKAREQVHMKSGAGAFMPMWVSATQAPLAGYTEVGEVETGKKRASERNQRILDNIFKEDADNLASQYSGQVAKSYRELYGISDNEIKKRFIKEITRNSYVNKDGTSNMGISQYQAFYGNGKDIKSEMANFSIDDMREVLAKKKVYEANMSPDMAMTALDNDARRYIHDHQGRLKKLGLFAKDVAISSMSYTADKINGIAELGRMAEDGLVKAGVMDKPVVWMDDTGNIIDLNKTKTFRDKKGNLLYKGEDGKNHYLHQTQIGYSALHQLGKDTDGSDLEGAWGKADWLTLNPQYWSRAEQFGTLDANLQKQYEKIGASPYKVVYNPGDDSDLIYEGFKMISFGLADQAAMFVPFGIGAVGRGLQAISKTGKLVNGLGKALDVTGTFLSASKPAQYTQGLIGAGGIAYAYGRGAFQETLAENLANAEEAMTDKVKQGIYDRYQNDKKYKTSIDAMITAEAAKMKQEYKAQVQKDGNSQILDEKTIDKMLRAKAQDKVMASQIEAGIDKAKASGEFATLQEKAINSASNTALNSYWPEAIKYGLVNTFGHRKFLYQNSSGVTRRISSSLKGLKEITTKDGLKRLVADTPKKFKTWKQKSMEFGKTVASQAWGGAWTNGSDDMMVDAAERINHDSYDRYLEAYKSGEAAATTYGLVDGIFSYVAGLQNSLGQESTWQAAEVGALGSMINVGPNFTNIASLMTKEGRQNYKNQFWRTQLRDENGMPLRNEDGSLKFKQYTKKDKDGNPIKTDVKKNQQLLGQLNFFLQNGVLNTYYGKKMSARDLQNHADYVNGILDQYDDFKDIEGLVAANLAAQDIDGYGNATRGDKKTMNFLNALYAMKVLSNLGNKSDDAASMSSVVQKAKEMIDLASRANAEGKKALSEEEVTQLLSQYYAANPGIAQSEASAKEGLDIIAKNARILSDAEGMLSYAEERLSKIEKSMGKPFDPQVRTKYLINQALDLHWEERLKKMKSEIGDYEGPILAGSNIYIATIGGKKNAKALKTVYREQLKELEEAKSKDTKEEEKLNKEYQDALSAAEKEEQGTAKRIEADKKVEEAKAKLESIQQEIRYKNDYIEKTNSKLYLLNNDYSSSNVEEALNESNTAQADYTRAETELKLLEEKKKSWYDDKGNVKKGHNKQVEKANAEIKALKKTLAEKRQILDKTADRVLTSDEIMMLDPVYRARMLNTENRDLYSREQIAEIEKLEKELIDKDPDALQKVQDIALLTQRIQSNKDATWRIQQNPEAAAWAVESENRRAAASAYQLINQSIAESLQDYIQQVEDISKQHDDVTEDMKNEFIFNILKRQKYSALETIEKQNMIPQFSKQLSNAKDYVKTAGDIVSIVVNSNKTDEDKENLLRNVDAVLARSHNKAEILTNLEKIIDDVKDPIAVSDFKLILDGLERLGYQRDATVIENREKRKAREEAAKKKREEDKKKIDDAAKAAAQKKAIEDAEKKAAAKAAVEEGKDSSAAEEAFKKAEEERTKPANEVPANGEHLVPKGEDAGIVDQDMTDAVQKNVPGAWSVEIMIATEENKKATIDAGEVWATDKNNPHKEKVTIEKNGDIYTINTGGKPYTLSLGKEYHEMPKDATEETFNVNSFEKKGDNWYLNGTFANSKETTQVKATDKFNMDYAMEQLRGEREAYAATEGIDSNKNIVVEEDTVSGNSESVADQVAESQAEGKEVYSSEENTDTNTLNSGGRRRMNSDPNTLTANPLYRYVYESLEYDGVLEKRTGKEGDTMSKYFAWMEAAGIKLQNIIDFELSEILKVNPHAKVKFMAIRDEDNATHDKDMFSHLMLVLDYDDNINRGITSIHNEKNGGVIESQGKKYLIIGTAGYGNRNQDKLALYDILWNPYHPVLDLKTKRTRFFKEHADERFWVPEGLSTEVKPGSLIPGYVVRQSEIDSAPGVFRSVSELLEGPDKEVRNPTGRSFDNVAWGIQELTDSKFAVVGTTPDKVMVPRNALGNLGNAFVLMPAANGKLFPSYLKPLFYKEMKDGVLKQQVDKWLEMVTYSDKDTAKAAEVRTKAIIELSKIFYFDVENGNTIISRKSRNEISLIHNGQILSTFTLDSNFDRNAFLNAFMEMNPRVNITLRVLSNKELLRQWDEAGALTTDAAIFGEVGSAYEIYGVDSEGKMITPKETGNPKPKVTADSDFRANARQQVIFKRNYYTVENGTYYLNGIPVTDTNTIKQLEYNKRVLDNQLVPIIKDKGWNYYILSTGEHPEVIKIKDNSYEVKVTTEEQAKQLIEKVEKEEAERRRNEAAKNTMEKALAEGTAKTTDVLSTEGESLIDPTTGELVITDATDTQGKTIVEEDTNKEDKDNKDNPPAPSQHTDTKHTSTEDIGTDSSKKSTQNFSTLYKDRTYKKRIITTIKSKWKDAPSKVSELEDFLRNKDIEVDHIGTSKEDIEAWIHTLEDCRG